MPDDLDLGIIPLSGSLTSYKLPLEGSQLTLISFVLEGSKYNIIKIGLILISSVMLHHLK